jgi:quinol monooxygenase YgiN
MALHVIARFTARAVAVGELGALLISLVEPIRADPGCLRCHLVTTIGNPAEFTFIEEWVDEAALDKHLADPLVQQVVEKAAALLAEPFLFNKMLPCA